jgi:hypothetical protein
MLASQILDLSESTDDREAAFSGFLERKKKMVAEVKQVSYIYEWLCFQRFIVAYFSTHNSALHGRRTATQIVAQCYPMSRPNVLKSTFIYRIMFVSRKLVLHELLEVSRLDLSKLAMQRRMWLKFVGTVK